MHRKRILFIILLIAQIVLSAAQVRAIGTPEEQGEDVFDLGEVVVSSSALNAMEAAETVHEISAAEIKRSGARTIDEALVLQSDVNIQVGNEAVPRVNIRGFRSRHVLLLLDGVPMNSSFDQQFDPSMIPTENIEQIKVTAGASSVLYGQGGLGGVVNIITKKGLQDINGTLGYEAGDGQPYLGRATISGSRGRVDFFLSGSTFKRDHFPLAKNFDASTEEAEGYRKNSDSKRDNAFLHLGYTHDQDLYISMTANWVRGEYGKPASAIDNRFDPYAPPAKFGRVDWYGGHTFQLSADYSASKEFSLRSMVYYNRVDQDNNQYDNENYDTFDDIFVPNSYE
ncbi:TonB-dependent receptor, partial [archaeon]|nr:TonB-dependent receptor [archaeon]